MKQIFIAITIIMLLCISVNAMDFSPPQAPESVKPIVDRPSEDFSEGLWKVLNFALQEWAASFHQAVTIALRTAIIILISSIAKEFAGAAAAGAIQLSATIAVAISLTDPSSTLIRLGTDTVCELSEYGKLLMPVMTGALAAQGGLSSSTALYAGTALFNTILSNCIFKLLVPLIYLFLAISIANSAVQQDILGKIKALLRWLMTWSLKIILYLFTGYMAITGVISGTTDAAAVKAAKLTISGAVPVIGGILSDASEAVLVGTGVLRNAAGVYGLLTILAILAVPFVRIGVQYLVLKCLSAVSSSFSDSCASALIGDFSSIMGIILGMVSTQSILILISTVCFMKGMG